MAVAVDEAVPASVEGMSEGASAGDIVADDAAAVVVAPSSIAEHVGLDDVRGTLGGVHGDTVPAVYPVRVPWAAAVDVWAGLVRVDVLRADRGLASSRVAVGLALAAGARPGKGCGVGAAGGASAFGTAAVTLWVRDGGSQREAAVRTVDGPLWTGVGLKRPLSAVSGQA